MGFVWKMESTGKNSLLRWGPGVSWRAYRQGLGLFVMGSPINLAKIVPHILHGGFPPHHRSEVDLVRQLGLVYFTLPREEEYIHQDENIQNLVS